MCRFNLIIVEDNTAKDFLESEGYQLFFHNLPGYQVYQKGYCNCGSFIGSLIEKKGMNYSDAITKIREEKLDLLYRIKELMHEAGYQERKDEFLQKQSVFIEKLQDFSEYIYEYERIRSDEIQKGKEDSNINVSMEQLYNEIGNMFSELELQPDYQIVREAYMDFMNENDIMKESTRYYLTKEDQEKAFSPGIPLSELIDLREELNEDLEEEGAEQIEIKLESSVIDEVIERTENETNFEHLTEYHSYHKLFSDLLEHVTSFRFTTIWCQPGELKEIKTIHLDSLIIDDLAFLNFDEMISIIK